MESKKVSKKALRSLIKDSLQQSINHLELPKPNKKVKRVIKRATRKMAIEYSHLLKKEFKRSKPKKQKAAETQATQAA